MYRVTIRFATGDLTVEFEARSEEDTLGIAVVSLIEKLKQIIGDLQTEVSTLTTSASEIVASVSEVSTGSAETAAAVRFTGLERGRQAGREQPQRSRDFVGR